MTEGRENSSMWLHAMGATAAISVLPTLILPFIPASASVPGGGVQKILLAFAVGGMLGDVFLHLLPHLMTGDHAHSPEKTSSGNHLAPSAHDHSEQHHDHQDLSRDREHPDHAHGHDRHEDEHEHHAHDNSNTGSGGSASDRVQHTDHDGSAVLQAVTGALPSGLPFDDHRQGHGRGHSHGAHELQTGVVILLGFLFFFVAERLIRGLKGGHSHSHGHQAAENGRRKKDDDHRPPVGKGAVSDASQPAQETCAPSQGLSLSTLKIGGLLNLVADSLHNMTDGIAIGAAFVMGNSLGVATTLSTMLHELPHEIGDYAVLIQSGLSKKQAILCQFGTAIAAFIGTAIGLLSQRYEGAEKLLLAFTAGGFVYVSCVAVMPEVLSSRSGFWQAVAEVSALCAGIALMVIVAVMEHRSEQ